MTLGEKQQLQNLQSLILNFHSKITSEDDFKKALQDPNFHSYFEEIFRGRITPEDAMILLAKDKIELEKELHRKHAEWDDQRKTIEQYHKAQHRLPKLKVEKHKIDLHDGYFYVAELVGVYGFRASAETGELARKKLMAMIENMLVYELIESEMT